MDEAEHIGDGFRGAKLRAQCAYCRELAPGRCPRCGRWLCDKHAAAPLKQGPEQTAAQERRCKSCEDEYNKQGDRPGAKAEFVTLLWVIPLSLLLILIPLFVDISSWSKGAIVGVAASGLLLLIVVSIWISLSRTRAYEKKRRASFLAERSSCSEEA